jgi:cytochrome P450
MSDQSEARRYPFAPSPVPYDPGPEMRELMGRCPVNKVRLPDDSTAWLVSGFHKTREVMVDQRYSRDQDGERTNQVRGPGPASISRRSGRRWTSRSPHSFEPEVLWFEREYLRMAGW